MPADCLAIRKSHGCIHLPGVFARLLFEISPKGMTYARTPLFVIGVPLYAQTSGKVLEVVDADPPSGAGAAARHN